MGSKTGPRKGQYSKERLDAYSKGYDLIKKKPHACISEPLFDELAPLILWGQCVILRALYGTDLYDHAAKAFTGHDPLPDDTVFLPDRRYGLMVTSSSAGFGSCHANAVVEILKQSASLILPADTWYVINFNKHMYGTETSFSWLYRMEHTPPGKPVLYPWGSYPVDANTGVGIVGWQKT